MTNSLSIRTYSLEELGHGSAVKDLAGIASGIVLVSGPIGSGKTTTLRSLAHETSASRGRKSIELTSHGLPEDVGVEKYYMPERSHKGKVNVGRGNLDTLQKAHKYSLKTASDVMDLDIEVVFIDDLRRPETARIATHLAECGVLVIASVHNSGEPAEAIKFLDFLLSQLGVSGSCTGLVPAVLHQRLSRSLNGKFQLDSKVFTG